MTRNSLLLHHPHLFTERTQVLPLFSLSRLERIFLQKQLLQLVRCIKVCFFRLHPANDQPCTFLPARALTSGSNGGATSFRHIPSQSTPWNHGCALISCSPPPPSLYPNRRCISFSSHCGSLHQSPRPSNVDRTYPANGALSFLRTLVPHVLGPI